MHNVPRALYIAALVCYAASFLLPTFYMIGDGPPDKADNGLAAFTLTFFAPWDELWRDAAFGGLPFALWLANPAFWWATVLFAWGWDRGAVAMSCLALVLGGRLVFSPEVLLGYYVWLASMALLAAAVMARWPCRSGRQTI
jgi:hypothetical protein